MRRHPFIILFLTLLVAFLPFTSLTAHVPSQNSIQSHHPAVSTPDDFDSWLNDDPQWTRAIYIYDLLETLSSIYDASPNLFVQAENSAGENFSEATDCTRATHLLNPDQHLAEWLLSPGFELSSSFIQKELDASTGMMDFGARFYDPTIGRFISADPYMGRLNDPRTLARY